MDFEIQTDMENVMNASKVLQPCVTAIRLDSGMP
jgi:hypothetical protein